MLTKADQRVLYQTESAIEGIVDHLGGQSILLRSESVQAKEKLLKQIIALAEPQGFQVCRATISTDDDSLQHIPDPVLCTDISNCLEVTSTTEQEQAHQLEDCLSAIKAVAEVSPVLLILEDIHAAGRRTLERLARLISSAGEASVLLFMTSAYGGEGREKAWQGAMVNAPLTTIDLQ